MAKGPRQEAILRGFMALVLDMVRIDPDRRPTPEMIRWYRELAFDLGVTPTEVPTGRSLLDEGLRLARALREAQETVVGAR